MSSPNKSLVKEALKEPELAAGPSYHQHVHAQVVVGVLTKYVNLGKGWRHRLFVLKNGVLQYYKVLYAAAAAYCDPILGQRAVDHCRLSIFGPTAINVSQHFDELRKCGDLVPIGAETGVVEEQCRRSKSTARMEDGGYNPQGEMHMQVSHVRQSEADNRKFYVHSGTTTLRLRAETKEDRRAWVDALTKTKERWTDEPAIAPNGITPARVAGDDNKFLQLLEEVKGSLKQKGASDAVQAHVEDVLLTQHQHYHAYMTAEADKRRALIDHVKALENEKRQLETNIVVEERLRNPAPLERAASQETVDDEGEDDDQDSGSGSGASETEDDLFYDCDPSQLSADGLTRLRSSGSTGNPAEAGSSSDQAEPAGAVGSSAGGKQTQAAPAQVLPESQVELPVPGWLSEELPPPPRRDRLPKPQQVEKSVGLWSIIKECVGKDLTRVCLPVFFNEPLSALQKSAEDLEYAELLDKASACPAQSIDRLMYVAAFAVSGYSATAQRTQKPFNPLLGETFEFIYPEKGYRAIAEKVVHHPTIIAAHCEGRSWQFAGDAEVRSKFWGRYIELTPVGLIRLKFSDGDEYHWSKVTSSINNIIVGKLYIDHGGVMRIQNKKTDLAAKIKFKETGLLGGSKNAHQVKGTFEKNGHAFDHPTISGKWDETLTATMSDGSQKVLWQINPPAKQQTRYNFSEFAIKLNEVTSGLEKRLAPTDCRLRPDQHYLELGMYDEANAEKQRLEQKQRAARKAAERGDPIEPRWFRHIPNATQGEEPAYEYSGGYWEARRKGDYDGCRDIFGS